MEEMEHEAKILLQETTIMDKSTQIIQYQMIMSLMGIGKTTRKEIFYLILITKQITSILIYKVKFNRIRCPKDQIISFAHHTNKFRISRKMILHYKNN